MLSSEEREVSGSVVCPCGSAVFLVSLYLFLKLNVAALSFPMWALQNNNNRKYERLSLYNRLIRFT